MVSPTQSPLSVAPLSAPDRKRLLRDPLAWMHETGVEPSAEVTDLLRQLDQMREQLQQIAAASRQLSRAIGDAKKTGAPTDDLLRQKREQSEHETQLADQVVELEERLVQWCVASLEIEASSASSPDQSACTGGSSEPVGSIDVSMLSPEQHDEWDAFVRSAGNASVYHLSGWSTVISLAFGHTCHYLLARADGVVVGLLPLVQLNSQLFGNFLVSVPFFNYGGVLTHSTRVREALLDRATVLAQQLGCSHLELRDSRPLEGWPARTDKVAMWLALPDSADALWQQIGSKVRAQVKKAQSHGLTFRIGGGEMLNDFYRVFAINMRDLGTPVYDRRFFEIILRQGMGDPTLVVGYDTHGKAVSTAFLLRFGNRMEVPWASTLREANALNANMALYWQILTHACEQGCDTFDFGRSTQDAPTYRFKKQWGAQPVQLYWHYWLAGGGELPKLNPDNPKYRAAIAVWQRLPVWLTKIIGPPVVKNLP